MNSGETTGGIDAELRTLVESAFPQTTVEVVPEEADAPAAYRSADAQTAWKHMYDAARGREVPVLLEMLDGTWLRGEERWKAVTFLGYSLLTPEAHRRREAILQALAQEAAVKQRGKVPSDAVRIQGAALDAIMASTAGSDQKWGSLVAAIQASRSHMREIVRRLADLRPSDPAAVADASPVLVDAMIRCERIEDLDAVAGLVRRLDFRGAMPDLRRLLLAATSNLSARAARLLADWGDKQSAFEMRRAIDLYSKANDANVDDLVDALYRLEGSACVEYLVDVFRAAPAGLQEHLLLNALRQVHSASLARAVRGVSASTADVDLKDAARRYLESTGTMEAGAASAGGAPEIPVQAAPGAASAAEVAPGSSDPWQRLHEDPQPPPPPAASAAPPSATTEGSWRPTSLEADADSASWSGEGGAEARARRRMVEAEALERIRAQAAAGTLESEQTWKPYDPVTPYSVKPIAGMSPDRLSRLLTLGLVAVAVIVVIVMLLLGS